MEKKLSFHYGWVIAAIALAMILAVTLFSTGMAICLAAIRSKIGLTGTQTSMLVTIRSVTAFLIVLVMDVWFKTLGMRLGISVGLLFGAAGMLLFSIAGDNLALYSVGAALGGVTYGLCMMAAASILVRAWFNKYRGTVLGICSAGTGLSNFVFSYLLQRMIDVRGLAWTFIFQSVVFAVVAVGALLLLRNTPEEMGLEPVGGSDYVVSGKKSTSAGSHSVFLPSRDFWVMSFFILLLGMSASPAATHMALAFTSVGFEAASVASAASIAGLLMVIAKPVYGVLGDRIGHRVTAVLYTVLIAAGFMIVVCTLFSNASWMPMAAYVGYGIGGAVCTLGYPLWCMEWSPKQDYSKNLKRFQSAFQLGTLIASPIPGIVADITGSYAYFYVIPVLGYSLMTLCAMILYRKLDVLRRTAGED